MCELLLVSGAGFKQETCVRNRTDIMGENKLTRLCHIVKREDFDGYGFNLHAEKGKPGQYIGKVDDNSPAETAGLKQGDRIIEVNGVNIGNETHKQVVQRIKAISDEVQLLVVDPTIVPVSNNNQVIDGSTTKSVTSTMTVLADDMNANDTNDGAATATTNGRNGQSPASNKSNDSHAHNTTVNTTSMSKTKPGNIFTTRNFKRFSFFASLSLSFRILSFVDIKIFCH